MSENKSNQQLIKNPQEINNLNNNQANNQDSGIELVNKTSKISTSQQIANYNIGKVQQLGEKQEQTSNDKQNKTIYQQPKIQKPQPQWMIDLMEKRKKVGVFLDNFYFVFFMTTLTVFVLFGDDMRTLATDKNGDYIFWSLQLVCLVFFSIEFLLASIAKDDYLFGFFFWLDLISTATIIFDIGWINNQLFNSGTSNNAKNAGDVARAGRSSKIGTRAGRIVRIIRLVRMVKLYKAAHQALLEKQQMLEQKDKNEKQEKQDQQEDDVEQNQNNNSPMPQETNVGKKLSDLTTRRVITIVLSIMISIPLFDSSTFFEEKTASEYGLQFVMNRFNQYNDTKAANPNDPSLYMYYSAFDIARQTYVYDNIHQRGPLISLYIATTYETQLLYQNPSIDYNNLRNEEVLQYAYFNPRNGDQVISGLYSDMENYQLNAFFGISRTIFVCIVLTVAALSFTQDATDLVLQPIEDMLQKIRKIGQNPLEAAQMEEQEAVVKEELEKQLHMNKKNESQTYETAILEKTIIKLGALLALGFGEAGSEIIATNMERGGEVDPMIPGKKIMAIFGFCDIRNFTDATEVLQEEVMVFVNEIAEITHTIVDSMSGAANKNIGDAFLLVWKFPDDQVSSDPNNPSILMLKDSVVAKQIADMAVISFLKVIATINLSKKLKKYNEHEGLNQRMPNYHVKMGFGLHVGWAIEGAIGSEFKIDASYLSPNVNMSSRLEAATKQFGVPILISGPLHKVMTPETQQQLRRIDRVTVKGSIDPIDFFTVDCDIANLKKKIQICEFDKEAVENVSSNEKKKMRFRKRIKRNNLKKEVLKSTSSIIYKRCFQGDREIRTMRETYQKEFYELWDQGMKLYLEGKWPQAKAIFEKTYAMSPDKEDGPSKTLLEVIKDHQDKAPADWKGYRELTEK